MSPHCAYEGLRYRSPDVGRLGLKGHEFGRDIVLWSGDQHVREHISIPRIHRQLANAYGVPICERSVGNLVSDYLALCDCVAGDSGRVQERLKRQGAIVLCVDGVQFDDSAPVLYVQRDAISGEVLYAERRLARGTADLVPMLRRIKALAAAIEVPIIGIASDKERSLVPAIAEVFPTVPHQFCQTHFLKNVATPLQEDDRALASVANETVLAVRKVQRTIERRFPAVAVGVGLAAPPPAPPAGRPGEPASPPAAAAPDAEVAAELALAGTTVGLVSGRAITDPPGLKRLQRLQWVRAAVEQAARKSGAPPTGWPLLEQLRAAFRPLEAVRPVANRLGRHVQIVRTVAHILKTGRLPPPADSSAAGGRRGTTPRASRGPMPDAPTAEPAPPAAAQVQRVLRQYLDRLQAGAPRRGRGAATGHFVDHLVNVANRYWDGLFHTYDHPEIPATTNALEGFFGASKRARRATTGRASTAGGKMQSAGEFVVGAQLLVGTMAQDELAERLTAVPDAAYVASKKQLLGVQEPARKRRSVQRRLEPSLDRAVDKWIGRPATRGP